MKIIKILSGLFAIILSSILFCSCDYNQPKNLNLENTLGVWWWDNRLDNSYLDFAKQNGVNEIYYYTSTFDEKNKNFIKLANENNIDVFWLTGEYTWIDNKESFFDELNKYIEFQNSSKYKFAGVHLDVEPHQNPSFEENREEILINFVNFIYNTVNLYENINFDIDIPFWLDDVITFNNETKETYKFLIDFADRTFIMSYRDNAQNIYNVAKEELDYANLNNKKIFLGVETGNEEDIVTFKEEGKTFMYNELYKLNTMINSNFGLSIHHIKTWKELAN